MKKIAFNTANLVGRVSGYRFKLNDWMDQHHKTVAQTDEREWAKICAEIAAAGYRAVEIWLAHIDPATMTDVRAKSFRKIMDDAGLVPIALAGPLNDGTARVCQQLGIPMCCGGLWDTDAATIKRLTSSTNVGFNFENHPEKSAAEIRSKLEGLGDRAGLAIDTGWLGTQGIDAPQAIRDLAPLVKHVHLKDVVATGGHATCPLGEGVVDIAGVCDALRDIGYKGWYSWEDEPEARSPMDIAAAMREWIEQRVAD